jgi:hypothetical protein
VHTPKAQVPFALRQNPEHIVRPGGKDAIEGNLQPKLFGEADLACQDSNFPFLLLSNFVGRAPTGSLQAIAATAQGCSRGLPYIFNNARRAAGLPSGAIEKRQLSNLKGLTA